MCLVLRTELLRGLMVPACLSLLLGSGCSRPSEGLVRVAVAGTITLDGLPVERGSIDLFPTAAGSDLRKASGLVIAGQYDIPAARGPNVGTYRAEIHWPKPTGRKISGFTDIGEDVVDEQAEAIPPRYNARSTLLVELKPGPNTHDFRLTSQ
jgi:hypothetical protein